MSTGTEKKPSIEAQAPQTYLQVEAGIYRYKDKEGKVTYHERPSINGTRTYRSLGYNFTALDMTPDGRWLVSGGDDGLVCLWSLAEPRLHWRQRTQLDGVAAVAVSPDAQTIAAYSRASVSL